MHHLHTEQSLNITSLRETATPARNRFTRARRVLVLGWLLGACRPIGVIDVSIRGQEIFCQQGISFAFGAAFGFLDISPNVLSHLEKAGIKYAAAAEAGDSPSPLSHVQSISDVLWMYIYNWLIWKGRKARVLELRWTTEPDWTLFSACKYCIIADLTAPFLRICSFDSVYINSRGGVNIFKVPHTRQPPLIHRSQKQVKLTMKFYVNYLFVILFLSKVLATPIPRSKFWARLTFCEYRC